MSIPIVSQVLDLVGSAVDKIWPDAETKEQAKMQMQALIMQQAMQSEQLLFQDTEGARELFKAELDAKKAPALARFFQVMARPFCMYSCITMYVWNKISPLLGGPTIPLDEKDYWLIGSVFVFLFGARSFEKVRGKA